MAAGWACSLRETCQKQMEAATRTCRTVGSRLWSREAATRGTEPAPRGAAGRSTGWLVCNDVVAQASSAGPTVPCLRGCTWLPDSPYLPLSSPVPTMPTMPTWGALVVAESCTAWLWPDQQTAGWCRLLQPAMRVRYVNRVYLDIPACMCIHPYIGGTCSLYTSPVVGDPSAWLARCAYIRTLPAYLHGRAKALY